jgi:type I restriction enzyme S subunit
MRKKLNSQSFFLLGDCDDPGYRNIRDNPDKQLARDFVESLYIRFKNLSIADPNFLDDAKNNFHARFWEMYLAVTLSEQGFQLNKDTRGGPEFYFMHNNLKIWVEAVAPSPGCGNDKVPHFRDGNVRGPQEEKIILRFTNALSNKKGQYTNALKRGIISSTDYYIIAINSYLIPYGPLGDTVPYFVKAFLPVGSPAFAFKKDQQKFDDNIYYITRENIEKQNKEIVSTNNLLNQNYSFISAILHSGANCLYRPATLGSDFSILYNPNQHLDDILFDWCADQWRFNVSDGTLENTRYN